MFFQKLIQMNNYNLRCSWKKNSRIFLFSQNTKTNQTPQTIFFLFFGLLFLFFCLAWLVPVYSFFLSMKIKKRNVLKARDLIIFVSLKRFIILFFSLCFSFWFQWYRPPKFRLKISYSFIQQKWSFLCVWVLMLSGTQSLFISLEYCWYRV